MGWLSELAGSLRQDIDFLAQVVDDHLTNHPDGGGDHDHQPILDRLAEMRASLDENAIEDALNAEIDARQDDELIALRNSVVDLNERVGRQHELDEAIIDRIERLENGNPPPPPPPPPPDPDEALLFLSLSPDRSEPSMLDGATVPPDTPIYIFAIDELVAPVQFAATGPIAHSRAENVAPYDFNGGSGENATPWQPPSGNYTVSVSDDEGRTEEVAFVVSGSPPPPPPPEPSSGEIGAHLGRGLAWTPVALSQNVMRIARPNPGGSSGTLDERGYPLTGVNEWILMIDTHVSETILTCSWEGSGRIRSVWGRCELINDNQIRVLESNGNSSVWLKTEGRLDNLEVNLPDDDWEKCKQQAGRFSCLRFLDEGLVNSKKAATKRIYTGDAAMTYTSALGSYPQANGWPYDVLAAFCNEVGSDYWLNVPHGRTDDEYAEIFQMIKDNIGDRKVYVEFSNESWNWKFGVFGWLDKTNKHGTGNISQEYCLESERIWKMARTFFGDQQVNVLAGQQHGGGNLIYGRGGWEGAAYKSGMDLTLIDAVAFTHYASEIGLHSPGGRDHDELTNNGIDIDILSQRSGRRVRHFAYEAGPEKISDYDLMMDILDSAAAGGIELLVVLSVLGKNSSDWGVAWRWWDWDPNTMTSMKALDDWMTARGQ